MAGGGAGAEARRGAGAEAQPGPARCGFAARGQRQSAVNSVTDSPEPGKVTNQPVRAAEPQMTKVQRRGDAKTTRMLHNNIEKIISAKAIKNEGSLRLRQLEKTGKAQLALENASRAKKQRKRDDTQAVALKNAQKRYEKE